MMTLSAEAITSSTGARVLFQDRNVEAASGKMGCGGDPTDPRADDNHGFWFHSLPSRCEAIGRDRVPTPRKLIIAESASQLIRNPVPTPFLSLYWGRSQ